MDGLLAIKNTTQGECVRKKYKRVELESLLHLSLPTHSEFTKLIPMRKLTASSSQPSLSLFEARMSASADFQKGLTAYKS